MALHFRKAEVERIQHQKDLKRLKIDEVEG